MSCATATVFVVDDDVSIRESLGPLIRVAGWQSEVFASANEFLARPRARCSAIVALRAWEFSEFTKLRRTRK